MFGLRVTLRCWNDDLGRRDSPSLEFAARDNLLVRDFLNTRRQNPDGHEGPIAALGVPFMKLKAGRERGVTLYEREPQGYAGIQDPDLTFPGVVWLVARGFRSEGSADDAYEEFAGMGRDRLSPSQTDYADLYSDIHADVVAGLRSAFEDAAHELLEMAAREPGVVHELDVEVAEIGMAIVLLDTAEYRILVLPTLDRNRRPIPEEIHIAVIEIVFGHARLDQLEYPDPGILAELRYSAGSSDYLLAELRQRRRR